jgi:hypothetical protein
MKQKDKKENKKDKKKERRKGFCDKSKGLFLYDFYFFFL